VPCFSSRGPLRGEDFFAERQSYNASFSLKASEYPELKHATIVVQDWSEKVHIGVKATALIPKTNEDGLSVAEEMFGEYVVMNKECSISEMLGAVKTLIERISLEIKNAKHGDKA
jgi:aspartate-semialdehyde dehydrogenase